MDKIVSAPKNHVNMQNVSCADVDGTHDTSMQGSIPPENGSNTHETMHDTSIPPRNSETLSNTQEKSPDMIISSLAMKENGFLVLIVLNHLPLIIL